MSSGSNSSYFSNRACALFSSSSFTASIKLGRGNFLVWESIVLPLIQGNRLEGHINGPIVAPLCMVPSPTLPDTNIQNPEFDEWYATDRMLLGWLRNTMSQDVSTQLIHCTSTRELWQEARDLTCATSKALIMTLRSDLIGI